MSEVFTVPLSAAVLLLVLLVLLLGMRMGSGIKAVLTQVDELTKL